MFVLRKISRKWEISRKWASLNRKISVVTVKGLLLHFFPYPRQDVMASNQETCDDGVITAIECPELANNAEPSNSDIATQQPDMLLGDVQLTPTNVTSTHAGPQCTISQCADSKSSENACTDTQSDTTQPVNDPCSRRLSNGSEFEDELSEAPVIHYDFESKDPLMIAENHTEFKTEDCFTKGCKWAPDGTCLLTNSNDNTLRLWNLPQQLYHCSTWRTHDIVSDFQPVLFIKEGGLIYDYSWYPLMSSWNPVSCCLASVSADSPTHLWDAFTGDLRATYRAYNQVDEVEAARSVAFDPYGERLYCGFRNCVRVFDVSIPGRKCSTRNLKNLSGDCQAGIVSCLAVSPCIASLYAVGTYLNTIGLYTEENGKALCILRGHEGGLTHLQFSPDGMRLYSGARRDSEILCWDLREPGKVLFSIPRLVTNHQRVYFDVSADGRYLLSGTMDGVVCVWDTQASLSGEILSAPVKTFQAHSDCCNGISINQQHPVIASSSGQRHLLNLADSSDDECDPVILGKKSKIERENSVKLWWVGDVMQFVSETEAGSDPN